MTIPRISYFWARLATLIVLTVFFGSDVRSQTLSQNADRSECLSQPTQCRSAQFALIGLSTGLLVGGTMLTYHAARLDPENGTAGEVVKTTGILGGISITSLGALGIIGGIVRLRGVKENSSRLSAVPVLSGSHLGVHLTIRFR